MDKMKKLAVAAAIALACAGAWAQAGTTSAKAPQTTKFPSGVELTVLREGAGPSPTAADEVTVHYRGTLTDGREFDSSYARGAPARFPLRGVVPCWTEAVQKMKVGSKAVLVCPPATAYGSRGAGNAVPPNATLRFEVELLGVAGR